MLQILTNFIQTTKFNTSNKSIKSELIQDILYHEAVTGEEATCVINQFASDLVDNMVEILDFMPELGIIRVKNLRPAFDCLNQKILVNDFLFEIFEDFPISVLS